MPADLDALIAMMPFARQLGLVLEEANAGRVVARLDWARHLCTTSGIMHGGVLMSLADTAGALVAFLGLGRATLGVCRRVRAAMTAKLLRKPLHPYQRG